MDRYDEFSQGLDSLENNLITVVNDLKASTEIILKELTGYLNVSAHDLSEIRTTVIKIENVLDLLKNYIDRLDSIEKELTRICSNISKTEENIINSINTRFSSNNANMKKIAQMILQLQKNSTDGTKDTNNRLDLLEKQMRGVVISFKETKDELIKNQEGLYSIINNLTTGKNDLEKAKISLQNAKINLDTEHKNNKLMFWAKIIGILFGSGGVIILIIKMIFSIGG